MIFFGVVVSTHAYAITGTQVMEKVYEVSKQFKTEVYDTEMIVKSRGKERISYFQTCTSRKKYSDTLLRFYRPATLKGTGLLINKASETAESDTRLYLPALRAVKKIKGSERYKSFMGSDFTYADMIGRELNDDKHSLIKSDKHFYYVRSVPIKADNYSAFEYKVSKSLNIPVSVKFYNTMGELTKVLHNKKLANVKNKYIVSLSVMKNKVTKGSTQIRKTDINVNSNTSNRTFTIPFLKSARQCQ